MNKDKLISTGLFTNPTAAQLQGIDATLTAGAITDTRQLAYILATAYHETAKTMQPIEEYGKGKGKPYGEKLKYGGGPNKRVAYSTPDKLYFGRGHTQNTWYETYEKLTAHNTNGWDFLNNPELLLTMQPSVWATFYAMTTGLYTGRKLSQYFNDTVTDPVNARKIINGLDKADMIAGYYEKFMECLG